MKSDPAPPKRLIEVDLPIRRISEHARREKSIRHGHISTLHIWWARRPLAACRAVLCASLWPDPADDHCPAAFIETARSEMEEWCGFDRLDKLSLESQEHFNAWRKDLAQLAEPLVLREALLQFIADFANWDHSTDPDYLATSRTLTQSAHEALEGIPGTRPLVVDPFAGGGSIPLEALRVGGDVFASDLNPIPVLLNKVVLEYIPKYGKKLAQEVRRWGEWIKEEAERELGRFYPKDEDGATPIAYLQARTILSEDPGQNGLPVEVPLMKSMWLCNKSKNRKALRWVRDAKGQVLCDELEVAYADGHSRRVRRPQMEIFTPKNIKEVEEGTAARGSATCPVSGYTTPVASVRKQLSLRRGGAIDARLFCIVSVHPSLSGRRYRAPTIFDMQVILKAKEAVDYFERDGIKGSLTYTPEEEISLNEIRRISVPIYGMTRWGDLFTSRQILSLNTYSSLIKKISCINEPEMTSAVQTLLALSVSKMADLGCSLSRWKQDAECPVNLFGRQAIGMVWDFAEASPISISSGSWSSMFGRTVYAIESEIVQHSGSGQVFQCSATNHLLPNHSVNAYITDPPYYDAVPYAHLSDFCYVWLKRALFDVHKELFIHPCTPKTEEIVVDRPHSLSTSTKDITVYELMLTKAFSEGHRILRLDGIGVIVFASKTTASWEAVLKSVVDAGFIITGSWPIDTEMASKVAGIGQARLASSVHLVVRPRVVEGHAAVGDWREVLSELPKRIHAWLPRLAREGVVGADAIFACLGPALEIYSRYDSVEKASGEVVTLREYLEQVWAAVSREALSSVVSDADLSGFESDARLSAMWLWTVAGGASSDDVDSKDDGKATPGGFTLEYDTARKIAQGLGANLDTLRNVVEVKGDKATLLPVSARTAHLFGKDQKAIDTPARRKRSAQLDLFADLVQEGVTEQEWEEKTVTKAGETVLDRMHQAMILFAAGRGDALKRFLVDDGVGQDAALWRLAQAFSALYPPGTQEKRWVDGVLARKKGLGL